MRAHYLQHVSFEGLGSIEPWLRSGGATLSATRFFEAAALPGVEDVDLLIIMGGPMSVNDEARLPWLRPEKRFVGDVIAAGKPVLGICLGAQLIASAMGARVYSNREREIGWFPITLVQPLGGQASAPLRETTVFHWHGETFDLPPGAVHLARSSGCEHQAFQVGRQVIGLQFHLETTPRSLRGLIDNCRAEMVPATYVQPESEVLAAPPERFRSINAVMSDVLRFLTEASFSS
jgi:GMP synthase-like glutamine amidotransferase